MIPFVVISDFPGITLILPASCHVPLHLPDTSILPYFASICRNIAGIYWHIAGFLAILDVQVFVPIGWIFYFSLRFSEKLNNN